jgi:multiple sugar transport system substrate-binding protein
MSKKTLSCLLALAFIAMIFAGCSSSTSPSNSAAGTTSETPATSSTPNDPQDPDDTPQEENTLPAVTTENITLSYAYWGQAEKGEPEVVEAQKAAFIAKYPNITLDFIQIEQTQWEEALTNLAATGMLPDVFGVFSVSRAVMNEWALPLGEFYEGDPEVKDLPEIFVNNAKIDGKQYSVPSVMFPHLVFVNETLFAKYNTPLPSYEWTLDEFFNLATSLAHGEEFYFGMSNPLFEDLYPAWFNGQGKWGWDGKNYNFDSVWANALIKKWELVDANICEWESAEDKEKFLGSADAWPPGFGRSAMHMDWPWTIAMFEDTVPAQSGSTFLYYPLPVGPSGNQLVIVDNAIIGASTKYPREAWELMKETTWGKDANLIRQKAYRDVGLNLSRFPATANAAVWQDLVDNATNENFKQLLSTLQKQSPGFVPSNWPVAPGWGDVEAWINEQDIYGKIERHEINPNDVTAELTAKANELKDAWIKNMP